MSNDFEAPKNLDYTEYIVKKTSLGSAISFPYLDTVSENLSSYSKDNDSCTIEYTSSLYSNICNYYSYNMKNLIRYIINTYLNDYFPEISIGTSNNIVSGFDKMFDMDKYISIKDSLSNKSLINRSNIFYKATEAVGNIYNYLNNFAHYLATNYMITEVGTPEVIPIYEKLIPIAGIKSTIVPSRQDQYLSSVQIITEMFGIYYPFILESVYNILIVVSNMCQFPDDLKSNKSENEIKEISNNIIEYITENTTINTEEE